MNALIQLNDTVIYRNERTIYYGALHGENEVYVLDDAFILEPSNDADIEPPIFRLHCIYQTDGFPVTVQISRMYRPSETVVGILPYHGSKELILSNTYESIELKNLKIRHRIVLETRRSFLARTEFPEHVYCFSSPEYYWVDCPKTWVRPILTQSKPENIPSELRIVIPAVAIEKSRGLKVANISDETFERIAAASEEIPKKVVKSIKDFATEKIVPLNPPRANQPKETDLSSINSQDLLDDLTRSSDGMSKSRKRLKRNSSEFGSLKESDQPAATKQRKNRKTIEEDDFGVSEYDSTRRTSKEEQYADDGGGNDSDYGDIAFGASITDNNDNDIRNHASEDECSLDEPKTKPRKGGNQKKRVSDGFRSTFTSQSITSPITSPPAKKPRKLNNREMSIIDDEEDDVKEDEVVEDIDEEVEITHEDPDDDNWIHQIEKSPKGRKSSPSSIEKSPKGIVKSSNRKISSSKTIMVKTPTKARRQMIQLDMDDGNDLSSPKSLTRVSHLANEAKGLNNYKFYATDHGDDVNPPREDVLSHKKTQKSSKRNLESTSSSNSSECTRSSKEKNDIMILDDDDEVGLPSNDDSSDINAILKELETPSKPKSWLSKGKSTQTRIRFPSAKSSGLDVAVVALGSGSSSKADNASATPSSSKKKRVKALDIIGVPEAPTMITDYFETGKSPSKNKMVSPSKKRTRPAVDLDDEPTDLMDFVNTGGEARKVRKLAYDDDYIRGDSTGMDKSMELRRSRGAVQDDEIDEEMKDFITDDDSDIEVLSGKEPFLDDDETSDPQSLQNSDSEGDGSMNPEDSRAMLTHVANMDLDTAFQIYLQFLISSVINVDFASWARPAHRKDDYFTPALHKVKTQLFAVKNSLIQSSVWSSKVKQAVETYPNIQLLPLLEAAETCQACRRKHSASVEIVLSGIAYDSESYWDGVWVDNPKAGSKLAALRLHVGSTCAKRLNFYHKMQHLQHYLVRAITPKVEAIREGNAEDKILNEVMDEKECLHDFCGAFRGLLSSTTQFGLNSGTKTRTSEF